MCMIARFLASGFEAQSAEYHVPKDGRIIESCCDGDMC